MFRIRPTGVVPTKPPVFFQHGLFSDSSTWIINEALSPGFMVAKLGYDVWFGNNRGNIYSLKNNKLSPTKDKKKFWDFSFYTLGQYDVPAQIDYVIKETGYSKISYIGHSQGTS